MEVRLHSSFILIGKLLLNLQQTDQVVTCGRRKRERENLVFVPDIGAVVEFTWSVTTYVLRPAGTLLAWQAACTKVGKHCIFFFIYFLLMCGIMEHGQLSILLYTATSSLHITVNILIEPGVLGRTYKRRTDPQHMLLQTGYFKYVN